MFKEQIEKRIYDQFVAHSKTWLGFGPEPHGTPLETHIKNNTLGDSEVLDILQNAGEELASIHNQKGEGFGPIGKSDNTSIALINTVTTAITKRFSGHYPTWYDFMMDYYAEQNKNLDIALSEENNEKLIATPMNSEQREKFELIIGKRGQIRTYFDRHKKLLSEQQGVLNHGNVYPGSIIVDQNKKYSGLTDFAQMRLAPREAEFAYIYVMPNGREFEPKIASKYEGTLGIKLDEETKQIMIIFEAIRKVARRYYKYHYLGKYSEPLDILAEKIDHI